MAGKKKRAKAKRVDWTPKPERNAEIFNRHTMGGVKRRVLAEEYGLSIARIDSIIAEERHRRHRKALARRREREQQQRDAWIAAMRTGALPKQAGGLWFPCTPLYGASEELSPEKKETPGGGSDTVENSGAGTARGRSRSRRAKKKSLP